MRNRFVRLVLLGVLAFSATMAEALEAWVYGVSSNAGWYDNNKNGDGDYNLCWAASAANVINWWQRYSNYTSTTAPTGTGVWDTFKSTFANEMGNPVNALYWFYYGSPFVVDVSYNTGVDTAGGFYEDLASIDLEIYMTPSSGPALKESTMAKTILSYMEQKRGISLALTNDATNKLAHAITLWGMDYEVDVNGVYSINKLYVTDSDDYGISSEPRLYTLIKADYGTELSTTYEDVFVFTSEKDGWYSAYEGVDEDRKPVYNRVDDIYALALVNPIDLPEPSTGVLVLTGLGLLLRRRRRVA
ncbi:MAG: PEP-CTERM sorting domain-containing protein [Akkermansia sp.]|nr:PEP-CTERM sorting domain-containing protein [Akkermansia sp.]